MPPDLIIYALVAVGLVLWLRSVLGTRHGGERERPSPYLAPDPAAPSLLPLAEGEKLLTAEEKIAALAAVPGAVKAIAGESAQDGLIQIARADRNFDIQVFLDGAQDAFAMIVEAYAEGDREALRALLAPTVFAAFEHGINERERRGETQAADIHAIRKAEVIAARLDGRFAFITVRFLAEETSVTRDASGAIIGGHPDKVMPMRDVWVFSRDVKSRDPSWPVVETRGDFEGDNDQIPNTV